MSEDGQLTTQRETLSGWLAFGCGVAFVLVLFLPLVIPHELLIGFRLPPFILAHAFFLVSVNRGTPGGKKLATWGVLLVWGSVVGILATTFLAGFLIGFRP